MSSSIFGAPQPAASMTDAVDAVTTSAKQALSQLRVAFADEFQAHVRSLPPPLRAAFEAHGEPFVMVDDKEAPIGITGPTWIKKELVYTRVGDGNNTRIEVQSWS